MAILSLLLILAAAEPVSGPGPATQDSPSCPASGAGDQARAAHTRFDPLAVDLNAGKARTPPPPTPSPGRAEPLPADSPAKPPPQCDRIRFKQEFGPSQASKKN